MSSLDTTTEINMKLIVSGLLVFFCIIFFVDLQPGSPEVTYTAAIAFLMAFWWVTEALPIGITSFLPIILFPVLGILDGKDISDAYINYVIFLFIGGFVMALAMEKWSLHKRIALKILSVVGGSPFRIMLGFMLASSFLSMWMSNTATAMMMLPIAFSVTTALEEVYGEGKISSFAAGLLLSIAHACSIGGIATLVGTPPNLSFLRIFEIIYPGAPEISFGQWIMFAFPITLMIFMFSLFLLYLTYRPKGNIEALEASFFKDKYKALGDVTPEQKRVFVLFVCLALLWVFRSNLNLGFLTIPGWSTLFKNPKFLNDGTVAIFVAMLLFIVPSSKKKEALVDWKIMVKLPWHIVFLFGGGFALAKGFMDSGLSSYVGGLLGATKGMSAMNLVGTLTALMSVLTEFTSNTATTEMLLPIVSSLATEIEVNPLLIMIPVTLAASMAFMLPIATPPNAIVFGTGKLKMIQMIKTGIIIDIFATIVIVLMTLFWGTVVFDIDPSVFPDWAVSTVKDMQH
ncbi:SLC13 family permease [Formosa algae]|uniref:Sodium-dependent dicarboxylate transporter 2/3/5 n=1 Tax=Formosa algae TaxID=225843 RepID=A0A9X0YLX6_9FLAO|nr:SLC13 family permease [Formosa algae]MBP1840985.1 sodium-dependent dicarboxylate transporter 2/3/5 [Formosa algae]MDQ0336118.1 sodium-dependent dicarboxylate transporter 2/3/5 [Formosa algae]OEI79905.1 sodium:dicarboxylate symporter [Formosa algae]